MLHFIITTQAFIFVFKGIERMRASQLQFVLHYSYSSPQYSSWLASGTKTHFLHALLHLLMMILQNLKHQSSLCFIQNLNKSTSNLSLLYRQNYQHYLPKKEYQPFPSAINSAIVFTCNSLIVL